MIEETIQQIEARLRGATNLPAETRAELTGLLAKLRAEAARLPPMENQAEPVAAQAGRADESMQHNVDQLRRSVEQFEESHPRLVQLANHVANTLSGLGI
jgi:ABC-type transporter Mla subunit MlaD